VNGGFEIKKSRVALLDKLLYLAKTVVILCHSALTQNVADCRKFHSLFSPVFHAVRFFYILPQPAPFVKNLTKNFPGFPLLSSKRDV
jgi:hypothetical protein